MSESVLVMSIGPVQEFIAQARRSRDLWFGSHALSEVSRAATAAALETPGLTMVFPAVDRGDGELRPCDGPVRKETGMPPLNVGNHLLAVVPTAEVGDVATAMHDAAMKRWRELAISVRDRAKRDGLLAEGIDRVWDEQIGSLLEMSASTADIAEAGGYQSARRAAESALAGRKNLRVFHQWQHDRAGAPKSSFDGGRVSVLREVGERSAKAAAASRLGRNEQLDAVALVKRCGGEPHQFVPLANVALAAWIRNACEKAPKELRAAAERCDKENTDRVYRPDLPWVGWTRAGDAYDAEAFLDSRIGGFFAEITGIEGGELTSRCDEWRCNVLGPLLEKVGRPPEPYVCCVVADGDAMGRAISSLEDWGQHRRLSAALTKFAGRAHAIIGARSGLPIYTGGDDVLGFTTPEEAIELADALRAAFGGAMDSLEFLGEKPTLSVGLGVGHIMDGMAHLLALGRRAERLAKGADTADPKNALGVIVDKRSGGAVSWRGRWEEGAAEWMRSLADLMTSRRLPAGKVHEVRTMLHRLPAPTAGAGFEPVLRNEVLRILWRADGEGGGCLSPEEARLRLPAAEAGYPKLHAAVKGWVDACLAARAFVTTPVEPRP